MIKTNELKGLITARGYNMAEVAKALGISPKTFYMKMKKGVFNSDEIQKMIDLLEIEKPADVFFAKNVS